MEFTPSSMTQVISKGYDIEVSMEMTIPTKQYGNLKPRLCTTVTGFEDVSAVMKLFKKQLDSQNLMIKNKGV